MDSESQSEISTKRKMADDDDFERFRDAFEAGMGEMVKMMKSSRGDTKNDDSPPAFLKHQNVLQNNVQIVYEQKEHFHLVFIHLARIQNARTTKRHQI